MIDPSIVEIVKSVSMIVTAGAAIFAGISSMKNRTKIQEVRLLINGRMDQLLETAKSDGRIAEREEQRAMTESDVAKAAAAADGLVAHAATVAESLVTTAATIASDLVVTAVPAKTAIKAKK